MLQGRERKEQKTVSATAKDRGATKPKSGKLSYMDQREYDQMETNILAAESRLEELEQLMNAPEVMANPSQLQQFWQEQQSLQTKTDQLYERWDELERHKQG
jgi:ATP-binding cassette subfamily F protein uup